MAHIAETWDLDIDGVLALVAAEEADAGVAEGHWGHGGVCVMKGSRHKLRFAEHPAHHLQIVPPTSTGVFLCCCVLCLAFFCCVFVRLCVFGFVFESVVLFWFLLLVMHFKHPYSVNN